MNGIATALAEMIGGSFLQDAALFMLQNIPGFPPIIQTVHILGIAVVSISVCWEWQSRLRLFLS